MRISTDFTCSMPPALGGLFPTAQRNIPSVEHPDVSHISPAHFTFDALTFRRGV